MSFQQTAYSTPNFVVNNSSAANQSRNNVVSPWAVASHFPKSIVLNPVDTTLTPENLLSGALYTSFTGSANTVCAWKLPDTSSLYRFLATRSIPGYDNISNNDVFKWEVFIDGPTSGTGTLNIVSGTGAPSFQKPLVCAPGTTGASFTNFGIKWQVTTTGAWYNIF